MIPLKSTLLQNQNTSQRDLTIIWLANSWAEVSKQLQEKKNGITDRTECWPPLILYPHSSCCDREPSINKGGWMAPLPSRNCFTYSKAVNHWIVHIREVTMDSSEPLLSPLLVSFSAHWYFVFQMVLASHLSFMKSFDIEGTSYYFLLLLWWTGASSSPNGTLTFHLRNLYSRSFSFNCLE